jgi:hypothetical protein
LLKYLVMICRGHVPTRGVGPQKTKVNKDIEPFLKLFLPKGLKLNKANMMTAARRLHLAFKGMETEEVYAVLMEQLIGAIARYDPAYTEKVKLVAEVIDRELSKQEQFAVADVDRYLEFDCHRYIRLLCRRAFLAAATDREGGFTWCPLPRAGNPRNPWRQSAKARTAWQVNRRRSGNARSGCRR